MELARHFYRGSAHIDWCEPNYAISPNIAEFFNTVSNVLYLIIPPINIYLFWGYSSVIGGSFNIIWVLMMVIGASSAYFHATLSLVGQLLDEVAILWVLLAAYALWVPERVIQSTGLFSSRKSFKLVLAVVAIITTCFGFIYPAANSVFLLVLGVPSVPILWTENKRCKDNKVVKLSYIGIMWWFLAMMLWLCDCLLCDIWKSISFPFLHCGWHIFILFGSNIGCVLGCYFYALDEHKELKSELNFWPASLGSWGLPYIRVRQKFLKKKS